MFYNIFRTCICLVPFTYLSLEEVLIVKDCVLVSPCPNLIPDHLAMYFRAGVRLEVESLRVETSASVCVCVASRRDFGVGGVRWCTVSVTVIELRLHFPGLVDKVKVPWNTSRYRPCLSQAMFVDNIFHTVQLDICIQTVHYIRAKFPTVISKYHKSGRNDSSNTMCQIQIHLSILKSSLHCKCKFVWNNLKTSYFINFFQMATRLLLVTATMNLPSGENATLSSMVSPSTREPSSILGHGTMPKSGRSHGIS